MDRKKILKLVSQIIFFGALWGITEATLGYLLHFLPPTIAGIIMFPIAAFILIKAYKATGSRAALIYIGFIAAGIKAVDFLLPGMIVFKTINPMISIVLEALVVAVAYPMLSNLKAGWKLSGGIAASVGWRTGYIIYMVIQYFVTGFVSSYISVPASAISFILLNGIMSGILVFGVLMLESKVKINVMKIRPVYALAALVLAMGLQIII